MVTSCLLGFLMYYGIVRICFKPSGETSKVQGILIGCGIVLPLSLWIPFIFMEFGQIHNVALRLGLGCVPLTLTFSTLEAICGFVPSYATKSLWDYLVYVGFVLRPQIKHGQYVPWTSLSFLRSIRRHLVGLGLFAVLYNLAEPCNFRPFLTRQAFKDRRFSFEPGQLYNTFLQASTYIREAMVGSLFSDSRTKSKNFGPFASTPRWVALHSNAQSHSII